MNLKEIKLDTYKKFNGKDMGDFTVECMREAVRHALELATQRADVRCHLDSKYKKMLHTVDPDSILDVMEDLE